jgi:hypothetical protein
MSNSVVAYYTRYRINKQLDNKKGGLFRDRLLNFNMFSGGYASVHTDSFAGRVPQMNTGFV